MSGEFREMVSTYWLQYVALDQKEQRAHLNATQKGMYWDLFDHYAAYGSLPERSDAEALARIACVSRGVWKRQAEPVLAMFEWVSDEPSGRQNGDKIFTKCRQNGDKMFTVAETKYSRHGWLDAERKRISATIKVRSEAGKSGNVTRWGKPNGDRKVIAFATRNLSQKDRREEKKKEKEEGC